LRKCIEERKLRKVLLKGKQCEKQSRLVQSQTSTD